MDSTYSKDRLDKEKEVFGNSGYSGKLLNYASNLLLAVKDVPSYVKSISDIGIDFSLIGKKSKIGISRKESGDYMDEEAAMYNALAKDSDTQIDTKETPYFNRKYPERVKFLNVFSTHPEIEYITHQICDEMIVYDKNGYFCELSLGDLNLNEDIKNTIEKNFKKMHTLLNFNDGITAWAYALQWIIEGYLAFEVFYDDVDDPRRIVGFQELRPDTLVPMVITKEYDKEDSEGNSTGKKGKRKIKIWKQIVKKKPGGQIVEKILQDNQVIFISFNKIPGQKGRISYVERLVRSFNLMRTMENTKVAWNIMNSQFRLKMIIPVGTKTTAKAKQALAMATSKYKEDLLIDHDSGEIQINGQAKINYGRNIVLPARQGQTPDIDGVKYQGPDLSNMDGVKYFERKLWRDSNLPFSRFEKDSGSGRTILFDASGIPHDELTFYKLINRLRKEFEKIIREATYRQTILDKPELKIDLELKSKLGIKYESNSLIEEAKRQEIENQKINSISTLERLTELDNRTPIYSKKFLYVTKFEVLSEEEWVENRRLRDEELTDIADREKQNSGRF